MDTALNWARHAAGDFTIIEADDDREVVVQRGGTRLRLRHDPDAHYFRTDRATLPYAEVAHALRDDPDLSQHVPEVWAFDLDTGWTLSQYVDAAILPRHPATPRQVIDQVPLVCAAATRMMQAGDEETVNDYRELVDEVERAAYTDDPDVAAALATLGLPGAGTLDTLLDYDPEPRPGVLVHGGLRREVVRVSGDRVWVEGWDQARFGDAVGELASVLVGLDVVGGDKQRLAARWAEVFPAEFIAGPRGDLAQYVAAYRVLDAYRQVRRHAHYAATVDERLWTAKWASRGVAADREEVARALRVVAHGL